MTATDEIIPISKLFFDGPGPHVVHVGFPPRNSQGNYTPARGHELQALLNTSIVQLGAVSGESARKTPIRPQPAISIDTLLYRGKAALERALEVREEIVSRGADASAEQVEELLDLVALAATE